MSGREMAREAVYYATGLVNFAAREPSDFIFMLAMPRSGSTLLSHLLDTSQAILTIGESKTVYRSRRDLVRTVGKVKTMQRRHGLESKPDARYILDKIVHNRLLTPAGYELLRDERIKVIFLTREPRGTVNSLMRVMKKVDATQAVNMYIDRTNALAEQAAYIGQTRPGFLVDYEQIIRCTQPLLTELERFLALPDRLSQNYQVTPLTGNIGVGDNSPEIKAGRVLGQTDKAAHSSPSLPEELLAKAQAVYESGLEDMRKHCVSIDANDCQAKE